MARKKNGKTATLNGAFLVSNDIMVIFANAKKAQERKETIRKEDIRLDDGVRTKPKYGKRNPEDNLGNCIGESDIPKSDSGMDSSDIGKYAVAVCGRKGLGIRTILNEFDLLDMCDNFDCRLHDILKSLMEQFPEDFDIGFLRSKVRPFVYSLRKEKIGYERGIEGCGYKAIFEYIG